MIQSHRGGLDYGGQGPKPSPKKRSFDTTSAANCRLHSTEPGYSLEHRYGALRKRRKDQIELFESTIAELRRAQETERSLSAASRGLIQELEHENLMLRLRIGELTMANRFSEK